MGKDFDSFMKNPFWKKYYEDAPSEACKQYIALQFFNSYRVSNGEKPVSFAEERNELEKDFGVGDCCAEVGYNCG